MKLLLIFLSFLGFSVNILFAGTPEAPDMQKIRDNILDFGSQYYYPRLMKRYLNNDTTLTLNEYRHLYLGYSFQEGYDPYRTTPQQEGMISLYTNSDPTENDCDTIIKYAMLGIEDFPFDLRQINRLIYAYKCKKEMEKMKKWSYKLEKIIDAILSTGDGTSPETAWYVIYTGHEYDIVNRLGLSATQYVFIDPCYDFIEAAANQFNIKGCYFNVSRILEEYNRKFN